MIKLLVYTDGKPDALRALHFAAKLKRRLDAELSVITVRSGTHAAEEPPPVGVKLSANQRTRLAHGLQILLRAASVLVDEAVLAPIDTIKIRDIPQGYMFFCDGAVDERIAFYECFGHFVEAINKEVDEHGYSLLIVAPHRRGRLGQLVAGNTTRELALNLNTSLLVVYGGGPDSRFLICADGSPSSNRIFPMLKQLLPAIQQPIDILFVRLPNAESQIVESAEACLQEAGKWLSGCQKIGAVNVRESRSREDTILEAAGEASIIMMGGSLRHDVYRRMLGSLPMRILERTPSSVLIVKRLPVDDPEFMKAPFTCV
jgi:nucleotide-binding universal stress UspA family protein